MPSAAGHAVSLSSRSTIRSSSLLGMSRSTRSYARRPTGPCWARPSTASTSQGFPIHSRVSSSDDALDEPSDALSVSISCLPSATAAEFGTAVEAPAGACVAVAVCGRSASETAATARAPVGNCAPMVVTHAAAVADMTAAGPTGGCATVLGIPAATTAVVWAEAPLGARPAMVFIGAAAVPVRAWAVWCNTRSASDTRQYPFGERDT